MRTLRLFQIRRGLLFEERLGTRTTNVASWQSFMIHTEQANGTVK